MRRKNKALDTETEPKRKPKAKFQAEREETIKLNPVKPLNEKQKQYMQMLESKTVVVATGFAGTSKTYLPTSLAADKFRVGKIKKIVFCRPAVSNSKSVGFFKGSVEEKMKVWLTPVISILYERLGKAAVEIAVKNEDISYIPLETIKGCSFNDTWIIVDEAEDLTVDEIKKVITRIGKNSTMILAGDITQSELKDKSGLKWLIDFATKNPSLDEDFGFVDFNSPTDIVRSSAVKRFILALHPEAKANALYSHSSSLDEDNARIIAKLENLY